MNKYTVIFEGVDRSAPKGSGFRKKKLVVNADSPNDARQKVYTNYKYVRFIDIWKGKES